VAGHTGRDAELILGKSDVETVAALTGDAFGGKVDLSARINASTADRTELSLGGVGLDAGKLAQVAELPGIKGALTGDILLSVEIDGDQVIQGKTRGHGEISIFGGQLPPPDLWAAAGNRPGSSDAARFSVLAAKVAVADGSFELRDVRLTGPGGTLTGNAAMDVASKEITGRLVPGAGAAAPAYPVVLSGAFDRMIAEPVVPDPRQQAASESAIATATAPLAEPPDATVPQPEADTEIALAQTNPAAETATNDAAEAPADGAEEGVTDPTARLITVAVPLPIPAPR
jgi:hypothetical protein